MIAAPLKIRRSQDFRKAVKPVEAISKDAVSVMGLDLSHTSTGICLISNVSMTGELFIEARSVGADLPKTATLQQKWERMHMIAMEIRAMVKGAGVRHLGIEGAAYGYAQNAYFLGNLTGVVLEAILGDVDLVPPPALHVIAPLQGRKKLMGRGVKDKKLVQQFLREKCGLDFPNGDVADSFVIANYVWATVNGAGSFGLRQYDLDGLANALGVKPRRKRSPDVGD